MTQRLIETIRVIAGRTCPNGVKRAVVTYRNGKTVADDPMTRLFLS